MATVFGTPGNDFIHRAGDGRTPRAGLTEILGVTIGDDTIAGGLGDDTIFGDGGNDRLSGGAGNDILDGGAGADAMTGGAGDDIFIVDNFGDTILEARGGGIDTVKSSVHHRLAAEIENLVLTGTAALKGVGNSLDNTITGNGAANTLDGGAGADTLVGGAGDDTYIIDDIGDRVIEGLAGGIDTVKSSISYALAANVENLTLIGAAAIDGTGNRLDNVITGNAGANILDGRGGADTMAGGAGNDTYIVDNVGDRVIESRAGGVDTVKSWITHTLAANVENLTLAGFTALDGMGNAADNVIAGTAGANRLDGYGGNDTLEGGRGNDILSGGDGTDILRGGAGDDTLLIGSSANPVDGVIVDNWGGAVDVLVPEYVAGVYAGEVYDGGSGKDTLKIDATLVGTGVDLSVTTLGGLENLIADRASVTLTAAQLDGFTGKIAAYELRLAGAGAADISDADLGGEFGDTRIRLSNAGSTLTLGVSNVTVSGGAGNDVVIISDAHGVPSNYRQFDTFLFGYGGDDTLQGSIGHEEIMGGAGLDIVHGGAGSDFLYISYASEVVAGEVYDGGDGIDTLDGSHDDTSAFDLSGVTLTGLENVVGFYSGLTLTAAQLDSFTGDIQTGDITLTDSGNIDISDASIQIFGSTRNRPTTFNLSDAGNGLVLGDNYTEGMGSHDYLVNGGAAADTVTIANGSDYDGATLLGNGGDDILKGAGANDILDGGAGEDMLFGGAGIDQLKGGAGNDTLTGGAGSDRFIFASSSASGFDTITDFSGRTSFGGGAGEHDVLRFEGLLHGTFDYRGSQVFTGSGNTEARVSGDRVLVDTDGDGSANITITLTGLTSASQLSAADFLFV